MDLFIEQCQRMIFIHRLLLWCSCSESVCGVASPGVLLQYTTIQHSFSLATSQCSRSQTQQLPQQLPPLLSFCALFFHFSIFFILLYFIFLLVNCYLKLFSCIVCALFVCSFPFAASHLIFISICRD